jgi:DNA-directed RNA polymerase III subunit RPC4
VQLPPTLPVADAENSTTALHPADLPEGYLGKILIYKSGKVKLRVGDVLFDMSMGTATACYQQVVCIDEENKQALALGNVSVRTLVTPDLDSLICNNINQDSL